MGNELLSKIHQTYRVQYIQDVVLPTPAVFEENMLSTLSSFIFFNKVEIVSLIQEDERFLSELFHQLSSDEDVPMEKRRDLVLFLKEFCTFSQTLQPTSREAFFKTLSSLGVLSALEITLGLDDAVIKSASIDILSYIVEFSPSMVREYMMQQQHKTEEEQYLLNIIIEQMVVDSDPEMGGAVQLMGILRILIDPENMMATVTKSERADFLAFFYKHSMHSLGSPKHTFLVLMDAFVRNNGRYNLLDSAIIEMFEYIKVEDIKSLWMSVVKSLEKVLAQVDYVQTFLLCECDINSIKNRLRDRDRNTSLDGDTICHLLGLLLNNGNKDNNNTATALSSEGNKSPVPARKKVSLVAYERKFLMKRREEEEEEAGEEDQEEEEEEKDSKVPSAKRPRLSSD
ncbi:serine/threonine-protein phosphatase 4 regulatory subunit 3A-like [Penaeus monodon]|uniref:serine/threonine-protein phosphatase 4 regulatory subunit 3A-like n=1 Tax=Penaeus monodon TaxID=6687 RepID=UPI0018A773F1|nr:serine/threonine-protein phosphatase 4 regulatory subunit 3A-like [Penaeus monodon]